MKHILTAAGLLLALSLPALSAQVIPDGIYQIKAKHSGKMLDVSGASTSNSAQIIQWSSHNGLNQKWNIQYDEQDGTYLITMKYSDKCLDVSGASTSNNADLIQYEIKSDNTHNQRFYIEQVETGYYKITAKHSGKVLDIAGASTGDGAHLHQYTWNGGNNQRFAFVPTTIPADGITSSGTACATRYPVILVHGVALGDMTLGFDYFGRIPNYLRSRGAKVEGGGQDAWSNSSDNAAQLRTKISQVKVKYNVTKVNIIAHSKGGIDTRYMLKNFSDTRTWLASFTTTASPMKGSVLADIILGVVPSWAQPYVGNIINVIGLIVQGDDSPDSIAAGNQLKRSTMSSFNSSVASEDSLTAGRSGIYTQSYAAKIKGLVLDVALQATGACMALGGESGNDGAVWTESAKYANFKGIQEGAWWCGGVTHFAICDRGILIFPGFTPGFDARELHVSILSDLKARGF